MRASTGKQKHMRAVDGEGAGGMVWHVRGTPARLCRVEEP